MFTDHLTRRMITSIFVFMALVCLVIFLTYNRTIKQDDGWYLSWVFRWMQDLGNTNIKAYWNYTDTNDLDAGCSFVFTVTEGLYFSIFGISVPGMKALNAAEAIILSALIYIYIRKENRFLGLITVIALLGWNMFHIHFFNRPELPASILAIIVLYIFSYRTYSRKQLFIAFFLLGVLLDLHPLSLFLVAGMTVKTFFKEKDKRISCIMGGISGLILYFLGNYIVNHSFGMFTGVIQGSQASLGDHYIPILETGITDIISITRERFTFITKTSTIGNILKLVCFTTIFGAGLYLLFTRRLFKNRLIINSFIIYSVFIVLSTFLSEATSNGFRLYHTIAFALFYFALLYTIFNTPPVKYLSFLGIIPFLIFAKDSLPLIRQNYNYHLANRYYVTFQAFNDRIPSNTKVLMRPTHAFFTYDRNIRFDYTYGLLRYMYKNRLSFKDAIIQKQYDYAAFDELFRLEFFTDTASPARTTPAPYYYPLRNTGITSTAFQHLIQSGFLIPVASLYDAFAGQTVLYKIDRTK